MKYNYICNKCRHEKTIEQSMNEKLLRDIPCDKCKEGVMNQNFSKKLKSMNFNIPCTFNDDTYRPKNIKGDSSELEDYIGELDG